MFSHTCMQEHRPCEQEDSCVLIWMERAFHPSRTPWFPPPETQHPSSLPTHSFIVIVSVSGKKSKQGLVNKWSSINPVNHKQHRSDRSWAICFPLPHNALSFQPGKSQQYQGLGLTFSTLQSRYFLCTEGAGPRTLLPMAYSPQLLGTKCRAIKMWKVQPPW